MTSGPIAAAVAGIPSTALECRRRRAHDWQPHSARLDRRVWTETEACGRCGAFRTSHLSDADGIQLDAWRYQYPEG